MGRPPRKSLKQGIMSSSLTWGFTVNCFFRAVSGLFVVSVFLRFAYAAASFLVSHRAFIQTGVVIWNPRLSRRMIVGWACPIMRVLRVSSFLAGHVCPWKRPIVSRVMPVEGCSWMFWGSSGSRFPSWLPRIIWMSAILVFRVSKNSGISFHSPGSALAMVCFTSPRIRSVFGLVFFVRWRRFWRIFGVCDGMCIPLLARFISQPRWRSAMIRVLCCFWV